jgi:hypothetical protein
MVSDSRVSTVAAVVGAIILIWLAVLAGALITDGRRSMTDMSSHFLVCRTRRADGQPT